MDTELIYINYSIYTGNRDHILSEPMLIPKGSDPWKWAEAMAKNHCDDTMDVEVNSVGYKSSDMISGTYEDLIDGDLERLDENGDLIPETQQR